MVIASRSDRAGLGAVFGVQAAEVGGEPVVRLWMAVSPAGVALVPEVESECLSLWPGLDAALAAERLGWMLGRRPVVVRSVALAAPGWYADQRVSRPWGVEVEVGTGEMLRLLSLGGLYASAVRAAELATRIAMARREGCP